jgi:hypothetical protein
MSMLPDPLPTNPDELEALYKELVMQDQVDQAEFDRLMEARLRAWGYDPQHILPEQILGLMEESMNRLLINLYAAVEAAPDDESHDEIEQILGQAENLRSQINRMFGENTSLSDTTPANT